MLLRRTYFIKKHQATTCRASPLLSLVVAAALFKVQGLFGWQVDWLCAGPIDHVATCLEFRLTHFNRCSPANHAINKVRNHVDPGSSFPGKSVSGPQFITVHERLCQLRLKFESEEYNHQA